ncbi:MAG: DUF5752 family protein [Melioribacteraceae bacterium]
MSLIAKEPFQFYTRQNLTYLTGRKATNISELLANIKEVPEMSIYHHTHHYLEQHEFLSPEPPNDFAYWITNMLQDKLLGEEIASIDLRQYSSINEIRTRIIEVIEFSLNQNKESLSRTAFSGEEFHFMNARTFVFPTKYTANGLSDFAECLQKVSVHSIYYHVFEAKLFKIIPSFCEWLSSSLNEKELSEDFCKLDPYTQTLENLRKMLLDLVENKLKGDSNGKTK